MAGPRHLWSGEWERDSDAAAEALAASRVQLGAAAGSPAAAAHAPATAAARTRSSPHRVRQRTRGALRRIRRISARRKPLLVSLLVALLSGAAAFAVVASLAGSGPASAARKGHAWLGVAFASSPIMAGGFQSGFGGFQFAAGALVTAVVPGSPAADAGIDPGDVITEIGGMPVRSPQALEGEIAGMRAGDRVQIRYQQGQLAYVTQVTLEARPAAQP